MEKLYDGDAPVTQEVSQTTYDVRGNAQKKSLGERAVYPVQVQATIHWLNDGVPIEEDTVDTINVDEYPTTHGRLSALWRNHVEMRHLTYTLYLDAPLEDPSARIVGDGEWDPGLVGSPHAWPDFMWQPLSQTPSRRDYENPHVDYEGLVQRHVMPATAPEAPVIESEDHVSQDTPIAIPDNDPRGISSTIEVGRSGRISTATLNLTLKHTYRGDLVVKLTKGDKTVLLHDRSGGSADDLTRAFDLPDFTDLDAAGSWTLFVADLARVDVGTLESWSLDLVVSDADPIEPELPAERTERFSAGDLPLAIPDADPAGVASTLRIEASGTLTAVVVRAQIAHTWRGDLRVELIKDGATYRLHDREGRNAQDLTLEVPVEAFVGKQLRGDWVLRVSDHARADVGKLDAWSIEATWRP